MTGNMDLAIKPGGIIFLWTVSALLVLLLVVGIFSNRVRQYFYAHPKVEFWVGGTYFVCPFLLLEQYMDWWRAALIALVLSLVFEFLLRKNKRKA
ncbi:hypothetical protein SAMN05444376_2343 [Bacteroides clarus YIT 12056]|uniref:Conserved domain protein n=1 Tax=Bacteroides clarus YIT 12056 TaxID=762984 RepID=A0ABN0CMQ6_9BACE|nr:hypothetical protein [Bacteroides clarus]EGF51186.1 conserved domain protein [Bacteroides clarus YIT 12056]SHH02006.1 hypothetical protein SAMN05444376_2343 [Bacteroides clarus YIT 12056]